MNKEDTLKEIQKALEKLAYGKNSDIVRLILHGETLTDRQLKRLDIFSINTIKRSAAGISEIKLTDRLKALEMLTKLVLSTGDGANGFLSALTNCISSRDEEEEDNDEYQPV